VASKLNEAISPFRRDLTTIALSVLSLLDGVEVQTAAIYTVIVEHFDELSTLGKISALNCLLKCQLPNDQDYLVEILVFVMSLKPEFFGWVFAVH
jgi:hypothetical protein